MRLRRAPSVGLLLVWCCVTPEAHAADPQTYTVDLASTGAGAMDSTLRATSDLSSLRKTASVSPFGLIARARGEVDRLKTVLESYGYYQSQVNVKIEGLPLTDPGVVEALSALPVGRDARVSVSFDLGPLYHLGRVGLDGALPESAQGAFTLKSGEPAVAEVVLAAGTRVLSTLQEQGYAFAKVDPPVAYEDATQPLLDVTFHVEAGPRVKIGQIRIEGLQRVHERVARRRLTVRTGQLYNPAAIERARRDLLELGPFGSINVQVGTALDASDGVPLTFQIKERKRHAATISAAYSSDLGGSGGITWTDRNVFGNAEQLNVSASIINLGGGSATTGMGYDVSAKLTRPDFLRRDQSIQFAVGALKQSLQAYDQKALTAGVTLNRTLSSVWSASVGLTAADERINQEAPPGSEATLCPNIKNLATEICKTNYSYTLVAMPITLTYDSTHLNSPLDDPLHGMRNSLSVAPTQSLGRPSTSFVITQLKLAGYVDLQNLIASAPGRSVFAVRGLAGLASGASQFSLPPDQRFYGGGSATVRGYAYQSVGPKFRDGNPIGGTAIIAGSLEVRQRFGQSWGAAAFVDAGQVSANFKILPNVVRVGVGLGMRYYTPIGPIRLDLAVPTRKDPGDSNFEIYIGLGQAF